MKLELRKEEGRLYMRSDNMKKKKKKLTAQDIVNEVKKSFDK